MRFYLIVETELDMDELEQELLEIDVTAELITKTREQLDHFIHFMNEHNKEVRPSG